VESGLLEIDHIREHVDLLAQSYAQVERRHGGVDAKYLFNEALQLMQNILTDDLIATTLANARAIGATSLDEVRAAPARLATFSPLAEAQRQQEKRYLYETLYSCHALSLEHEKAEQVVTALFDYWVAEPEELPSGYVEQIESEGLARVVADYIAGMTDSFILLQYAQVKRAVRREHKPLSL
jgi:dGTPase